MTIFTTIIVVLLLVALGYAYMRYVEPSIITVTHHEIVSDYVSDGTHGLKIAQFNDTHVGFSYDLDDMRRVAEKINNEDCDIVVFAGDLFDNYVKSSELGDELSEILGGMKARVGKFAVLGNHDYGANSVNNVKRILTDGGFTVLVNESVRLPQLSLCITGIDDSLIGYGNTRILGTLEESDFNIVLCHEPDIFDECTETYVDLMLSGHTHGGQVKIPFIGAVMLPRMGQIYDEGLYAADNARSSQLYVNRGLGTTKMPLRFMSVPEITVLELKK